MRGGAVLVAKQCYRCKHTLPVEQFAKNRTTRDGLQANCRACANVIRREYEVKHADAIALRHAEKLAREPERSATKTCRKCSETKPLLAFYAHRSTIDGRANYCIDCARTYQREWNSRNKEKIREGNQRRRSDPAKRERYNRQMRQNWLKLYGLTPEGYDELLAAQGGVCAICGLPGQTWAERNLHVDHDHATHEVRGLLCGKCNVGIGMLGDSVEGLRNALKYLENPPTVISENTRRES
jgi:hypothetical protein